MALKVLSSTELKFARQSTALCTALHHRDTKKIRAGLPAFRKAFELLPIDKKWNNAFLYSRFIERASRIIRASSGVTTEIYVFYHLNAQAEPEVEDAVLQGFIPVNLDRLDVPDTLRSPSFTEAENRALLGEYLGILSVSPNSEMVGCFTYTVPRKFSHAWAQESGWTDTFLPEITFQGIRELQFDLANLYAVELKSPNDRNGRYFNHIPQELIFSQQPQVGPFKGSFVVSRQAFIGLQAYLAKVLKTIISGDGLEKIPEQDSQFGLSKTAARSENQRRLDRLRHTLGNVLERAVAHYLGEQYPASKKVLLGKCIERTARLDSLIKAARHHSVKNTIILTFADSGYIQVAQKWLEHIESLAIRNYVVICLDNHIYEVLQEQGVHSVMLPFRGKFGGIMAFRTQCIIDVLKSGVDVIHSDADAFWKRDALASDFFGKQGDIIASQGTIWPPEALEAWGFVLCSGLCFYRANNEVVSLMECFHSLIIKFGSDQKAFNLALVAQEVEWEERPADYFLEFDGARFSCFTKPLIGKSSQLTVVLLPHKEFQRLKEPEHLPYVAHLLSKKGVADEKLKVDHKEWGSEAQERTEGSSCNSLVWLASYPRSGNTMLRISIKDEFDLPSRSVYNDINDIGADPNTAQRVGHIDEDWSGLPGPLTDMKPCDYSAFDFLRHKSEPVLLKTHALWSPGVIQDKAICIVRDGRAALVSHAAYKQNFLRDERRKSVLVEEMILAPDQFCNTWSENVRSWSNHPANLRLDIQFEHFVKDPEQHLDKISAFIGHERAGKNVAEFQELKRINQNFFRKGHMSSWKDVFDEHTHLLFWVINYKEMLQFGYDDVPDPFYWIIPGSAIASTPGDQPRTTCRPVDVNLIEEFCVWLDSCYHKHYKMIKKRSTRFTLTRLYMALECLTVFLKNHEAPVHLERLQLIKRSLNNLFTEKGWLLPIVYVLCPTYNATAYIDSTFLSIAGQEGEFYVRLHVQDGCSKDDTFGIVRKWQQAITSGTVPNLSEGIIVTSSQQLDHGMYDALNKGAANLYIPNCAVMTWINADDCLLPGAFATMTMTLSQHPEVQWVIPAKRTFGEVGELRGCGSPQVSQQQIAAGQCDGVVCPVIQQEGVYWRSSLWHEAGGVNGDLKLAGDWDLWCQFARIGEPRYLAHPLAMFRKRRSQLGSDKSAYMREINSVRECSSFSLDKKKKRLADDRILVFDVDRSYSDGTRYVVKVRKPNSRQRK